MAHASDPAKAAVEALGRLKAAGLRPSAHRLRLIALLFGEKDRHVTADQLFEEAREAGLKVSLATIYNTLGAFTEKGLLATVPLGGGKVLYDTNVAPHFHVYLEETGELIEMEPDFEALSRLPDRLGHVDPSRIDIVGRVRRPNSTEEKPDD